MNSRIQDLISEPTVLLRNVIAALTVSFVALSLGAAFGLQSGRGAFAGMMSAALIALITSLLGGTRVQCSGPTGPMTTVMAVIFGIATSSLADRLPGVDANHFLNLTLILMGVFLVLAGLLRLGRFVTLVPNVVISGFMSGIAIIIWIDQIKGLFGWGNRPSLEGDLIINLTVAILTTYLVFQIPKIARRFMPKFASLLSGTFIAIILVTAACQLAKIDIERVALAESINSFRDLANLIRANVPTDWSLPVIMVAIPFALQLTLLAYLDTLLTSLVVDKMTNTTTKPNQELAAQGLGQAIVAFVGGIPGAQATIRSVLLVKEGATLRLAGILVGVFALIEMLIFQQWIQLVPKAVFAGVLIKVGYDVFDWVPFQQFVRQIFPRSTNGKTAATRLGASSDTIHVTLLEIIFISGTALVTVLYDLNVAVLTFTALFYVYNLVLFRNRPIADLKKGSETQGFDDED
jgi:SulP family sulfate permease